MTISLANTSDLTKGRIESLLQLIDTPEKRRAFLTDMCTLREYLERLFIFENTPFKEKESHPAYRILITANEMIGSLLCSEDELKYSPAGKWGVIVEVNEAVKQPENDKTPMPILNSLKEYKEYCKVAGLTYG